MGIYKKPSKRSHKGFFYLNDEVVINSLSALESGKVDEIISRTTTAREGGFSGDVRVPIPAVQFSAAAGKKSSSEIEEEMVRTRTRFSVFEAWFDCLQHEKSLGSFEGWGSTALEGVTPGDTVKLQAELSLGSLQTALRWYLWFADQAVKPDSPFAQSKEKNKEIKQSAKMIKALMGITAEDDEIPLLAIPQGDDGPQVVLSISRRWLIGKLGQLGGNFEIIGQVTRVIPHGEEFPILRLTKDIVPAPLEIDTLKIAVGEFVEPAKQIGVNVGPEESTVKGPALILDPIAIYR